MNKFDPKSICTIIAKNYISFARTLCDSFLKYHNDGCCFVLIIDDIGNYVLPEKENFEVIRIEELKIPNLREFCFKYNITELSTAVKPYFLKYLLDEKQITKLLYLDPDILVTYALDQLYEKLDKSDIIITPHLNADYPDDGLFPDDAHIMKSGIFNLGFIGLKKCDNVNRFLLWWQNKVYHKCIIEHSSGYFVDQKFIDLSICLFENISIITNTGYNVAYWNLHSRRIGYDKNKWSCNNEQLYFFHFSSYKVECPDQISKYQNRISISDQPQLCKLFALYKELLIRNGYTNTTNWPYTYSSFTNGKKIDALFRKIYVKYKNKISVDDPFDYSNYPISYKMKYAIIFFYLHIIDKFLTFIRVRLWPFVDDFISLKNKDSL
jgi:hypothetical protein